ncbi:MAG: 30S ribosome-binding factor RbfA [Bacteroidota bacterium]
METTRQNKISRLIQKDMGDIFIKMSHHFTNALITVTAVKISPDLSIAKIYVSIFSPRGKEEILSLIKEKRNEFRHELALREGKQLRIIPNLDFFIDDSLDYIENIDKLLKNN